MRESLGIDLCGARMKRVRPRLPYDVRKAQISAPPILRVPFTLVEPQATTERGMLLDPEEGTRKALPAGGAGICTGTYGPRQLVSDATGVLVDDSSGRYPSSALCRMSQHDHDGWKEVCVDTNLFQ